MRNLFTLICCMAALHLCAQDGSLDPTFGTGGKTYADAPSLSASLSKVVVQPDGKIVIVGRAANCCGYDFSVARFNADGSLDLTFDGDGVVVTDFNGGWDIVTTVAVQPDGKIIAAGYSDNRFAMARYLVNGTLDNTFDGDGKVVSTFSNNSAIYSLLLSDGKILAGGVGMFGGNQDLTLARYLSNGTLDNTFDTDGVVNTPVGTAADYIYSLIQQPDGKIVAAGATYGTAADFVLARYNTNGTLDNTFDTDGKKVIDMGNEDIAYSVAIGADGSLIAAGVSQFKMALARVLPDGSTDNTFDGDGKLVTNIGESFDQLFSVLIQSDGKIVAGGISHDVNDDFAVIRLNPNGSFDNTFDGDGKLRIDMGSGEGYATLTGWNNTLIIGGYSGSRLAVARLANTGTVLPVRLTGFTARARQQEVQLQWKASEEEGINRYEIEYSTDGVRYNRAGVVAASGNGPAEKSYSFVHARSPRGQLFYRLRIVEYNGQVIYSPVVQVKGNEGAVSIIRNPVTTTLVLRTTLEQKATVTIYNGNGQLVLQTAVNGAAGTDHSIDIQKLPKGIYYLHLQATGPVYTTSFLKN